jgi:hypothetical protein
MIAAISARVLLATLGLLACATSASAECAWVLSGGCWTRPSATCRPERRLAPARRQRVAEVERRREASA